MSQDRPHRTGMGHEKCAGTERRPWAQARMVYRAGLIVVILATMAFGWRRQVAIEDLRESLANIEQEEGTLRSEVARVDEELAKLRAEAAAERTEFRNVAARVANLAGQRSDRDLKETHGLTIRSEFMTMSVGGSESLESYVPKHLREAFPPILDAPAAEGEGP
jgi:hypothetical protein